MHHHEHACPIETCPTIYWPCEMPGHEADARPCPHHAEEHRCPEWPACTG